MAQKLQFPSGREYEVDGELTQAKVDEITAYDNSLSAGLDKKTEALPEHANPELKAKWDSGTWKDRMQMIVPWLKKSGAAALLKETPAGTVPKAILENGGALAGMAIPGNPVAGATGGASLGNRAYQGLATAVGAQPAFDPIANMQAAQEVPTQVAVGGAKMVLPAAGAVGGSALGPVGAAGGAMAGDALAQKFAMSIGAQDKFRPGELVASAISALPIPGSTAITAATVPKLPTYAANIATPQFAKRLATNAAVKDVAKFGTANAAAGAAEKLIDEHEMPTLGEAIAHFTAAGAAFPLAAFAETGSQVSDTLARKALKSARDETLRIVRKEGYVVPPITGGLIPSRDAGRIQKALENSSNRGDLKWEAATKNAPVTTRLAAEEVGLPKNEPIRYKELDKRIEEEAKPYREIAAISDNAKESLKGFRDALAQRNKLWSDYNHPMQANRVALEPQIAYQNQLIDMFEQDLENEARAVGKPKLVDEINKARVKIAQLNVVKRATNDSTGMVSAKELWRQSTPERPLTGKLATITRMYDAFPLFMQDIEKFGAPGVGNSNLIKAGTAGVGSLATMHMLGLPNSMSVPVSLAAAGMPLKADATRALLYSKAYQNSPLAQPYYGPMGPDLRASFLRFAAQRGMSPSLQNANNSPTPNP